MISKRNSHPTSPTRPQKKGCVANRVTLTPVEFFFGSKPALVSLVFSFLSTDDHFLLARSSKSLLETGRQAASWRKRVRVVSFQYCCGLRHFKGLPLYYLDLSGYPWLEDADLQNLKGMPLERLKLHEDSHFTDDGMKHLQGLPIQYFELHCSSNITDAGLRYIKGMPLLYLSIYDVKELTDARLERPSNIFCCPAPRRSPNKAWCNSVTCRSGA